MLLSSPGAKENPVFLLGNSVKDRDAGKPPRAQGASSYCQPKALITEKVMEHTTLQLKISVNLGGLISSAVGLWLFACVCVHGKSKDSPWGPTNW